MYALYQVPHGQKRDVAAERGRDPLRVLITVQCLGSILNIHGASSEDPVHQVRALRDAVRGEDADQVEMACLDYPASLDKCARLRTAFPNLKCVSKDLLHIALKVEQATNEKTTVFSSNIRRCLAKLRLGGFGRSRYYERSSGRNGPSELTAKIADMSESVARRLYKRIQSDSYVAKPYDSMSDFVDDLAAICATHPDATRRSTGKKATVLSSLEHATTVQELGYIRNFCKYVANNPTIEIMFGTTRNEAFHKRLTAFL